MVFCKSNASLLAVGVLAVALKVLSVAPPPPDADTLLNRVSERFAVHGLVEAGRANLTKDGTYRAARYATLTCQEAAVALPLLRNSEFKGLLDDPRFPVRYIVAGRVYDTFPELTLWREALLKRVRLVSPDLPPIAIVANPACISDVGRLGHPPRPSQNDPIAASH